MFYTPRNSDTWTEYRCDAPGCNASTPRRDHRVHGYGPPAPWVKIPDYHWGRLSSGRALGLHACSPEHRRAIYETRLAAERERVNARRRELAAERRQELTATCERCGSTFTPERSTARFCSTRCRVAAHRARLQAGPTA